MTSAVGAGERTVRNNVQDPAPKQPAFDGTPHWTWEREAAGLTITELAAWASLSRPLLAAIEHSRRWCSDYALERLGEVLEPQEPAMESQDLPGDLPGLTAPDIAAAVLERPRCPTAPV